MYAWCGVYGIVYVVYFVHYGVFCVVGIGGMVLGMWHWGVCCCLACRVLFGMNGVQYIERQVSYIVVLSVLCGVVSVVLYGMCCICCMVCIVSYSMYRTVCIVLYGIYFIFCIAFHHVFSAVLFIVLCSVLCVLYGLVGMVWYCGYYFVFCLL